MTENLNNTPPDYNFKDEPHVNPSVAAILALIFVFILYQFGGGLLHILIFGFDLKEANMNAFRLFTMGGQILFILAPTIIIANAVYQNKVSEVLRIKIPNWKEIIIFILGLALFVPFLQNFIIFQSYIIQELAELSSFFSTLKIFFDEMDKLLASTYGDILSTTSVLEMILVVLVVAVTPAFCEEFFFRGFVQKSFEYSIKPFWAIIISSTVFSLYHFNPYGFFALVILAGYFGFSAYISKSIFIPILLHFLNNLFSIIAYFIEGEDELLINSAVSFDEFQANLFSLVAFTFLIILFLFFVKKYYYKFTNKIEEAS